MVLNVNGLARSLLVAGLLAVSMVQATGGAAAESGGLPDDSLGRGIAPLLLLSRPDVREDLNLSEVQSKDAEQAIGDFYSRALALKGKKGPVSDAARKQINQDQVAWIDTHLTPDQRARLVQVELWWEGPSALVTRPIVGETVGLTPEQRATLIAAVKVRNDTRAKKSFSMADEDVLWKKTKATLSSSQFDRYKAMLGDVFHPRIALPEGPKKIIR